MRARQHDKNTGGQADSAAVTRWPATVEGIARQVLDPGRSAEFRDTIAKDEIQAPIPEDIRRARLQAGLWAWLQAHNQANATGAAVTSASRQHTEAVAAELAAIEALPMALLGLDRVTAPERVYTLGTFAILARVIGGERVSLSILPADQLTSDGEAPAT